MSIAKTMLCPLGLFRLLFLFYLVLPETGAARSACLLPDTDPGLKIACNSLNLLQAEKRSQGYSFDNRYLKYWEVRRDSCPNCPDPDKRMLAILMADRQGGSAQDYYDKLTDPDFVKKRVEKNTAGLISLGTLFVPWERFLGWGAKAVTRGGASLVNQTSTAILKNGYYEVNGFKFSEYYYNKLWGTGRGAPSLVAKEVLEGGIKTAVPDVLKAGFNKYTYGGWEMIFNPTTREVWHLQPIR